MSDGWPVSSIESMCLQVTSGGTPSRKVPEYFVAPTAGGTPWLKTKELEDRVIHDTEEHITGEAVSASSAKMLPKGTVVMAMYGATVGQLGILGKPMTCNQAVCAMVVDDTKADNRFLFYSLLHNRDSIINLAVGSAQQNLSGQVIKNLRMPFPSLAEQRRIAGVLGALDDLIEVNRGLVADLRSLTQVAFDQLQADATESTTLSEIITLQYGKALPATQRRPGKYPVVSSAGLVDTHDAHLVTGPGIVVGRKGTVGSVTWVQSDFFPIDTAFYVTSSLPMLYVYWLLKSQPLESMNTDSAVPGLNRENALSLHVKRPDDKSIGAFADAAAPLWSAARDLETEIHELGATRDELLPLLMSGRVRVAEGAAA